MIETLLFIKSTPLVFIAIVGVLSLLVGSFLNVVIYRLPRMLMDEDRAFCQQLLHPEKSAASLSTQSFNLAWPASHCVHCRERLKPWHNIPVLSYLCLKGRCAFCQGRIAPRYPLVEALFCCTSMLIAAHCGASWAGLCVWLFNAILFCLFFIDLDHQILPDSLTLSLLWVGLFASTYHLFISPSEAIWGALAGYLVFWVIAAMFSWITKKQGMGHGDFKLLAALGAFVGWKQLPLIIFVASCLGLIVGVITACIKKTPLRGARMAFGPYLIIAGHLAFFYGGVVLESILRFYV